jgi:pyridoxal phosphate enzyme (YggS family)
MSESRIKNNYLKIKESIPDNVLLVAVSKTRTVEEIKEAVSAGCRDFGENKAQELCGKYEVLPELNWHFIGRLQKNKVKKIVGKTVLIHSLDSMDLALEINRRADEAGIVQDVLIQVNPAGEIQKGGVSIDGARTLFSEINEKCANIRVKGFMLVAPETDDAETVRVYFKQTFSLFKEYDLDVLSMGMSGDYKVAVEEGANCIRIGSAIFGKRKYIKV